MIANTKEGYMDNAYAELSFKVGLFAAAADLHLRGTTFIMRARENCWNLTDDLLREWKQEAIALGVPAEHLEPSPDDLAIMPMMLTVGIRSQQIIDEEGTCLN
jgi:hypothetical protein